MGAGERGRSGTGKSRPSAPRNCYWRGETLWARFSVNGREYRESLRTGSPSVAEKRLKLRRQQIEDEAVYGDAPRISWKQAVAEWRQHIGGNVRAGTINRYVTSLRTLRTLLADMDVAQIGPATIRDIVRERRKAGTTNATVRRDLTALSSVLSFARQQGWVERNAAREYDRDQIRERRDPLIMPDETSIAIMLDHLPPSMADMARFARLTGMRLEEITSLTWAQINERNASAHLPHTKGKRGRTVHLCSESLAIVTRRPPYLGSPWVFWHGEGERYASASSNWQRVLRLIEKKKDSPKPEVAQKTAQFQRYRFHDLRHLYIVEQLRAGRSIYWVQKQVGHASIQQTEAYADVFLTPAEAARAREMTGTNHGTGAAVS